jgi:hypothetical protein
VHATVNRREADKDLFLLLSRRAESYEPQNQWNGTISTQRRDLLGASGWRSRPELLTALEVVTGYVSFRDHVASATDDKSLELLVGDLWWAARIANGSGESDARQSVIVGDTRLQLSMREPGAGALDACWDAALLAHGIQASNGVVVPGPIDSYYLALHDLATTGRELSQIELEQLDRLAYEHALPHGDFTDPHFASVAVHRYLTQLPRPPVDSTPPPPKLDPYRFVNRVVQRVLITLGR